MRFGMRDRCWSFLNPDAAARESLAAGSGALRRIARPLRFIKSKPQCGLRLLRSESVKPRSCILPTTSDGDRHGRAVR
jgi:fumarate hydratase class II